MVASGAAVAHGIPARAARRGLAPRPGFWHAGGMTRHHRTRCLFLLAATLAAVPPASSAPPEPAVHVVYMGGNDCPPCVHWRHQELPKLERSAEFRRIRFSYVQKTIKSTVPPAFFLPDEVKPLKSRLDHAGSGLSGSPQVAVFVDGEVYDYYFGSRSAEQVEEMLHAIRTGGLYPFVRCLKSGRPACVQTAM